MSFLSMRLDIINIALDEYRNPGARPYVFQEGWCSRFVFWCYYRAGLNVEWDHPTPGKVFCANHSPTTEPKMGDLVRWHNTHTALLYDLDKTSIVTIDGAMGYDKSVKLARRILPTSMKIYSIDFLIDQYEMTGANPHV